MALIVEVPSSQTLDDAEIKHPGDLARRQRAFRLLSALQLMAHVYGSKALLTLKLECDEVVQNQDRQVVSFQELTVQERLIRVQSDLALHLLPDDLPWPASQIIALPLDSRLWSWLAHHHWRFWQVSRSLHDTALFNQKVHCIPCPSKTAQRATLDGTGRAQNGASHDRLVPRPAFCHLIWNPPWREHDTPPETGQATMRSLHNSGEQLSLMPEAAQEAAWDYDANTGLIHRHRRWSEWLGLDSGSLKHPIDRYFERIHPEDRERMLERFALAVQHRLDYEGEYRLRHRDGGYFWVQDRGQIVAHDADGQPLRMSGTCSLITGRRQVSQTQLNSEAEFRQALHVAPIGMALVRPDGRWLDASPALCHMIGYPRETLLEGNVLSMVHPRDRESIQGFISRALNWELDVFHLEMRHLHHDGHPVRVQLNASLVCHNHSGMPHYFIFQIQEITDHPVV